jgi:hypothetical protein
MYYGADDPKSLQCYLLFVVVAAFAPVGFVSLVRTKHINKGRGSPHSPTGSFIVRFMQKEVCQSGCG